MTDELDLNGTWASAAEIWRDPAVRALFAAEWLRSDAWNAVYGKPPIERHLATDFGRAGIVNYFI